MCLGLRADEILANWTAPEVLRTGHHSQASDIYSLALVLWEIISGYVPFSEIKHQDSVRKMVSPLVLFHLCAL